MGNTDATGIRGSLLTINTECDTSGVGPDDISLMCSEETMGRFVTLQRVLIEFDPERPYLIINEIDIFVHV